MKRGGPTHPKTYELAELLGIRRCHAVGLLELLFHFAAQYAPEGDVGKYTDKRIAAACDWGASASKLVDALVQSRWLDVHPASRMVVHGWDEHADRTTLQRLTRAGKSTIKSNQQVTGNLCTQSETVGFNIGALPLPLPKPEPYPSRISGETTAEGVSKIKPIRKSKGEKLEPPEVETVIANISKNILARHPKMRNGSMSVNTVAKALRLIVRELELVDKIPRLLSIDENHAACCSQFEWQKDGGKFANGLNNWLAPTMDRFDSRPDLDQSKPQQPAVKRIIATADMF